MKTTANQYAKSLYEVIKEQMIIKILKHRVTKTVFVIGKLPKKKIGSGANEISIGFKI